MNRVTRVLFLSLVVGSAGLNAEPVSVPHSFVAGEKASAAEVNSNFSAVADGVNANQAAITSTQASVDDVQGSIESMATQIQENANSISVNAFNHGSLNGEVAIVTSSVQANEIAIQANASAIADNETSNLNLGSDLNNLESRVTSVEETQLAYGGMLAPGVYAGDVRLGSLVGLPNGSAGFTLNQQDILIEYTMQPLAVRQFNTVYESSDCSGDPYLRRPIGVGAGLFFRDLGKKILFDGGGGRAFYFVSYDYDYKRFSSIYVASSGECNAFNDLDSLARVYWNDVDITGIESSIVSGSLTIRIN